MPITHHAETESGAHYEFDERFLQVRRVAEPADTPEKRADGKWLRLMSIYPPYPVEGKSMTLIIESLSSLGPDDEGRENGGPFTTRYTTPVLKVWDEVSGE